MHFTEDPVEQRGLAAAEETGNHSHGRRYSCHDATLFHFQTAGVRNALLAETVSGPVHN
jgi:hypothetical protein